MKKEKEITAFHGDRASKIERGQTTSRDETKRVIFRETGFEQASNARQNKTRRDKTRQRLVVMTCVYVLRCVFVTCICNVCPYDTCDEVMKKQERMAAAGDDHKTNSSGSGAKRGTGPTPLYPCPLPTPHTQGGRGRRLCKKVSAVRERCGPIKPSIGGCCRRRNNNYY